MFNNKAEILKRVNMKIAGTLPSQKSNADEQKQPTEEEK
jgi:hypothetical protein